MVKELTFTAISLTLNSLYKANLLKFTYKSK
jgi:hypothetical protein